MHSYTDVCLNIPNSVHSPPLMPSLLPAAPSSCRKVNFVASWKMENNSRHVETILIQAQIQKGCVPNAKVDCLLNVPQHYFIKIPVSI